tara:strand:+ start:584 stop:2035 length:1452 start_codon:yes stop_codon:yes gene_type:complete
MVVKFTNQVIKYLVYGLIVNTLFSYIPQKQLPKSDILLMTSIIILSFVFLDFLSPSYDLNENFNVIENLDTIPDEPEENEEDNNTKVDIIISNKPEILKNLQDKKILDEDEINDILNICKDKEECNNKFLNLLNNNKINNEQLLELYVAFGLNNYNVVQELYLQERINREQSLEIAYSISSNSRTLIKAVIDKYLQNNVISKNDYDKLLESIIFVEDNNEGRSYVANMIKNNLLSSKDAKIINEKCSSSSMDSCSIHINKFRKDKLINNSQSISILKGYNKPGTNELINDNSEFGSISNENVIGSINEQTDLGDVNFTNNLLSDDELLKQSNSNNIENIESKKDFVKNFNNVIQENKNVKSLDMKSSNLYNKDLDKKTSDLYSKDSDMNYSIYSEKQNEPLGKFSKNFTNKFDHGFDYLETDKWKPPEYNNSICKIENDCDNCDENYEGYPVDIKNWNNSRKILPKDNINLKYIEDKLNNGSF